MKNDRQPLMLAYIIFMLLSFILFLINKVFNIININEWDKIINSITISSYFFTVSSVFKYNFKYNYKRIHTDVKYNKQYLQLLDSAKRVKELSDIIPSQKYIDSTNTDILYQEKRMAKLDMLAYGFDIIGYTCSFCILCFESVSNFFNRGQQIYSFFAFILILSLEYYKLTKGNNEEKWLSERIEEINKLLNRLEIFKNGEQVKNADAE